jgi:hypothetical protein
MRCFGGFGPLAWVCGVARQENYGEEIAMVRGASEPPFWGSGDHHRQEKTW